MICLGLPPEKIVYFWRRKTMKVFIFHINANEITNAEDGEKRSP